MRRLRELVLWAGAALGLLAVAAGLAVAFGGFGFLIFRSGSMSPEIPTGGIAVSRTVQAADIEPGDVVSVVAANGERITHRVVGSTLRGDEASLVLKGDANETADSEVYVVTSAERVVASVPVGGYVVAHLLSPPGLVALGSLSLMLVLLTGGRAEDDETPRSRPRHRARRTRQRVTAGAALVAVVAGGGATVSQTTGTWARFTDAATATTSSSAARLAPPTAVACTGSGSTSRYVTWTAAVAPPAVTTYRVTWSWTNGLQSGSGTTDVTGALQWRPDPGGLILGRDYTVSVASTSGSWVSTQVASANRVSVTPSGNYTCPSA